MVKPVVPIVDNPVWVLKDELRLNSILMLSDSVCERLTLEVGISYAFCKLVIVLLYCVLTEKWQLRWILYPFDGRLVYYRFATVEGVAYGEDYGLGFCGGTCSEVLLGKPILAVTWNQIKSSLSAILNVSVPVVATSFRVKNGY